MNAFKGGRIVHEFTQTNPAVPEKVFPLLCPVRESDWLPGWQYRLIYSDSGVAELGCVFTTPNPPGFDMTAETTWIVTEYDPAAFRIAYLWIIPGRIVTELRIQLSRGQEEPQFSRKERARNGAPKRATSTHIRYRYTGLSPEGNRELESYTQEWFENKMRNWERTINYYLQTGEKMSA